MDKDSVQNDKTQVNFIQEELNFNINSKDPVTKSFLNEEPSEEWIDILGNGQLKKKVILNGKSGTRPNRGDTCTLRIVGRLGNEISIVENYSKIVIQLGDMDVVQV